MLRQRLAVACKPITALLVCLAATASAYATPAMDAGTAAWWRTAQALSGDEMRGRDTGSEDHQRAVEYVIGRFQAAGLTPAGDAGGFMQAVSLHEVRVERAGTWFMLTDAAGVQTSLQFLHDITVRATSSLPATLSAPMSFRGYCAPADMDATLRGKIAVCFASRHHGQPSARDRLAAAAMAGATAVINVDDMGFTVEPPRWPDAYARSVTLAGAEQAAASLPMLRLNAAAFARLIAGSYRSADDLLADGAAARALPHFDLELRFDAAFAVSERDYLSNNVLGLLPGTKPSLKGETVVLSAHLDGYGIGEPVGGDSIYNGTFDDAAYVALLIHFAEQRKRHGFHRPILFAVFTGEEKGLLGSEWFVTHRTAVTVNISADLNLDAVRPLFPLKILTVLSLQESSLGADARKIGEHMGIEIRADREPERNLRERTDHWSFLNAGIPAVCFMFGFDPNTDAERIYREWYRTRYHKPADDAGQPFDGQAAKDFNDYVYRLLQLVADNPQPATLRKLN